MPGIREPTLGECWRPMMIEEYSRICHQPIDANNFELNPNLINMVQQQQFGVAFRKIPMGSCRTFYNCVAL